MVKKAIGVVVLHYNNTQDTFDCVQSFIDRLDCDNYVILVFDNCSPNGSGVVLKELFRNIPNVEVYLNDKNLGFGAGNNKGIRILREKYDIEFLVLSNNDIELLDDCFYEKVVAEYKQSHFAELGPMIKTIGEFYNSNPIFELPYYKSACLWNLKVTRRKLRALKTHTYWIYSRIRNISYRMFPSLRRKRPSPRKNINFDPTIRKENIVCHGCFMVFSQEFFNYYDGIDVRSFMYAEEDIIYAQIMSKGMKTVYAPNILVYHKEGRSVAISYGRDRKKEIFLLQRYIEAEKGYLALLNDLEKEGFTFKDER